MIRSLKSASLFVLAGMAPFAASQAAPGDYPFLCSTHPEDMRGVLHVTE